MLDIGSLYDQKSKLLLSNNSIFVLQMFYVKFFSSQIGRKEDTVQCVLRTSHFSPPRLTIIKIVCNYHLNLNQLTTMGMSRLNA